MTGPPWPAAMAGLSSTWSALFRPGHTARAGEGERSSSPDCRRRARRTGLTSLLLPSATRPADPTSTGAPALAWRLSVADGTTFRQPTFGPARPPPPAAQRCHRDGRDGLAQGPAELSDPMDRLGWPSPADASRAECPARRPRGSPRTARLIKIGRLSAALDVRDQLLALIVP